MEYTTVQIVHLLCACLFIGVVFFELVILEGIRKSMAEETMTAVETGLIGRVKYIMPWVVGTLFLTGIALAVQHFKGVSTPFASSFHILLAVKIALALSVLVHFVTALRSGVNGCMESTRFKYTHLSVAIHMLCIVILAKLMFVLHW